MFLFTIDESLTNIVEEQYYLAKKVNISWMDSSMMPEFERKMLIGLLMRDLKKEEEIAKESANNMK